MFKNRLLFDKSTLSLCKLKPKTMSKNVMPQGVATYLDRQNLRKNTTARVDGKGKHYRFIDGKWITEEDFQRLYPVILPMKTHYYKGVAIGHKVPY